jgi:Flp pilus assembly protein TadG
MMKRILRKLSPARRERGQSLVELAISLTVMLLLLSGAVTFGMALFSYVAMRDAAQDGALFGSFNPCTDATGATCTDSTAWNTAAIRTRVQEASNSPVNFYDPAVTITVDYTPNSPTQARPCEGIETGNTTPNGVQVTVGYDYPVFMPFIGAIIGDHINLRATVTDTILQPACP